MAPTEQRNPVLAASDNTRPTQPMQLLLHLFLHPRPMISPILSDEHHHTVLKGWVRRCVDRPFAHAQNQPVR